MKLSRRELLWQVGLGSITLASLPSLVDTLARPAWANDQMSFQFNCISAAGAKETQAAPQHRIVMGGCGTFNPRQVGSQVVGGGTFFHWLFPGANPPAGGTPLPLVASGTWKARLLVSYKQLGTYGVAAAGILEMVVDIFREIPSKAVFSGARLKVVCNIGAAGFQTGEHEGFLLSIPGTDFFTGGKPGPFVQMDPEIGITLFNTVPMPS